MLHEWVYFTIEQGYVVFQEVCMPLNNHTINCHQQSNGNVLTLILLRVEPARFFELWINGKLTTLTILAYLAYLSFMCFNWSEIVLCLCDISVF